MTNKELIEKLKNFDMNTEVRIETNNLPYQESIVNFEEYNNLIIIYTDNKMNENNFLR